MDDPEIEAYYKYDARVSEAVRKIIEVLTQETAAVMAEAGNPHSEMENAVEILSYVMLVTLIYHYCPDHRNLIRRYIHKLLEREINVPSEIIKTCVKCGKSIWKKAIRQRFGIFSQTIWDNLNLAIEDGKKKGYKGGRRETLREWGGGSKFNPKDVKRKEKSPSLYELRKLKEQTLLTVPEAAKLLRRTPSAVYHMVEHNKIPQDILFRVDSKVNLRTVPLLAWINSTQKAKHRKGG